MLRILFLVFASLILSPDYAWTQNEFRAGAAKGAITPPIGFPMWGYASRRDAPSKGVLDPLHARALVLQAGKDRLAIIALDLGRAPTREVTASIRRRVKQSASVSWVMLAASHTHHGPVLELSNWPKPKQPYVKKLEDDICRLIDQAAKNMQPARLGAATKAIDMNRNRHSRLPNRPVDNGLIALRVESMKGDAIAHVVNFAAHPTMHPAKSHKFSADFPGAMSAWVEQKTDAPCLFLQGASGDLSAKPKPRNGPNEFGKALGEIVVALAKSIRCDLGGRLKIIGRDRDFHFKSRVDLGNAFIRAAYSAAFFKELIDFYEREYRNGIRPHLTTVMIGDRIGLVGASGEFFCEHAIHLRNRARVPVLLFVGYCNDYQQYFPTIQAVAEGGYGADRTVAPVEIGAGEQMMNRALQDLYEMRGKIRDY